MQLLPSFEIGSWTEDDVVSWLLLTPSLAPGRWFRHSSTSHKCSQRGLGLRKVALGEVDKFLVFLFLMQ